MQALISCDETENALTGMRGYITVYVYNLLKRLKPFADFFFIKWIVFICLSWGFAAVATLLQSCRAITQGEEKMNLIDTKTSPSHQLASREAWTYEPTCQTRNNPLEFLAERSIHTTHIQWTLVTTTTFVCNDVAIKMNLVLYKILNKQVDL